MLIWGRTLAATELGVQIAYKCWFVWHSHQNCRLQLQGLLVLDFQAFFLISCVPSVPCCTHGMCMLHFAGKGEITTDFEALISPLQGRNCDYSINSQW